MPTTRPGFWPFLRTDQARMRATRQLFEYWHSAQAGGRALRRAEIDPTAIKSILPFIILGDIEAAPFRVHFRLVGTSVVEFSRMDFSGRYLDELSYTARDSVDWADCYRHVHGRREAIIGNNEICFQDGKVALYEFAILPLLRGDDPAGSFIACEAYEGFDRLVAPDLQPVTQRD